MSVLTPQQLERLGLDGRGRPDLYLTAEEVAGAPHAAAMRLAFEELRLAGVLCVEGTPTVAFLVDAAENPHRIDKVHRALWNQGLASLLLVIHPREEIRAYSLMRKPVDEAWRREGYQPDPRLVETLELTAQGMEAFHLISSVESGRFFAEHREHFDRESRVDRVLLANLFEARGRLVRERLDRRGLEASRAEAQAQALLLQVMFIAYLEDRGFLAEETFVEATDARASSLLTLLEGEDPAQVLRLFSILRQDFNGDLFLAPCTFDGSGHDGDLLAEDMNHLAEFRHGLVELETDQRRFWPYDFRYIPVELISAVYDRFLGEDSERKRASGAYYTSRPLADLAVSQTWEFLELDAVQDSAFRLLDPACGSGVFLVRIFQRATEHLRRAGNQRHLPWNTLVSLLNRLHGWDLEENAVKIAAFSLYVALLEEADPDTVRGRLRERRLLPPLVGRTLCTRDFFADDEPTCRFDVIVGNPPWVSRRRDATESARRWCEARGRAFPEGELAWGFAWKALEMVKSRGLVTFLLPAMGFLLNPKPTTQEARRRWLREVLLLRVVNLSDLVFQLFEGAARPTVLCLFRRSEGVPENYRFDYWCPKADRHLSTTGTLTLPSEDRSELTLAAVLDEPSIWKHRMWMRNPELKLVQWLETFPRLSDRLGTYKRAEQAGKRWTIGQGLQPATTAELSDESFQPKNCNFDPELPHLDQSELRRWVLPKRKRQPFGRPLRRCGFELGFRGPHVLVSQGSVRATGRLQAAYVEESLSFSHSLQAIHFPEADASDMKLLTAILNSGFTAWYFFHEAANPGAERAKVHEEELLRLPFVVPEDLGRPSEQADAARDIVATMDDLLGRRDEAFLDAGLAEIEERLDRLVYRYYGLSDSDAAVVEDGLQTIIPSVQPRRGAEPPLWRASRKEDWERYVSTLVRALGGWLGGERLLVGEIIGCNEDLAVLRLGFSSSARNLPLLVRTENGRLRDALKRIRGMLSHGRSKNLHLLPNLRVFLDDDLYLVKPRAIRFWLRSKALDDADAIAAHLFETSAGWRGD